MTGASLSHNAFLLFPAQTPDLSFPSPSHSSSFVAHHFTPPICPPVNPPTAPPTAPPPSSCIGRSLSSSSVINTTYLRNCLCPSFHSPAHKLPVSHASASDPHSNMGVGAVGPEKQKGPCNTSVIFVVPVTYNVRGEQSKWEPILYQSIKELCRAKKEFGQKSEFFRSILKASFASEHTHPCYIKQLFSCLLPPGRIQIIGKNTEEVSRGPSSRTPAVFQLLHQCRGRYYLR